ncbi:MAG: type IIL restriction-modification enzyme MmeI, partial [Thermomicrobiales bacterium]
MHVHEFQAKWRVATLTERAGYTAHFSDLCALLGQPTPSAADPSGQTYAFEKRVTKLDGATGFADVWRKGYFAWEYKGRGADLDAAYRQLNDYREPLENPPLLVVCDFDRIQIHTNFTGLRPVVHELTLETLDLPENLAVLRRMFTEPYALRPGAQDEDVTRQAAEKFGAIAGALRARGADPHATAHYLVQLLFCLFAEDVGLLPKGLFSNVVTAGVRDPEVFTRLAGDLLAAMRDGGYFGADRVAQFNGGLFNEVRVIPLAGAEIRTRQDAASLNWSRIEPAIFGTLFERSLDPNTRASVASFLLGAS